MNINNKLPNKLFLARIITGISLVLGILFDYFFFDKIPGIVFPLYAVLIIVGLFTISKIIREKINKESHWVSILIIFFSMMIFVRSSGLLTFFNVIASLVLLLILTEISFGQRLKSFSISNYLRIFFLPFRFFQPSFQTLSNLFLLHKEKESQKVLSQIIQGILMAIPFLFVFLLLFSSADLIFKDYISNLFSIRNELEIFLRFILILMVMVVFIGAYTYTFREKENQIPEQRKNEYHIVGYIESSILLGSVNILFFAFILIQLTYLFGGINNISSQGLTYAEYARRGFFELIAVAVISLLLIFTIEKFVIKKKTQHSLIFKILSTAIVIQVIIIMASAFTRLSLYEEAYGFTTLRLYSHTFIILLAIIFCLFLYKIHKDQRENVFAFSAFLSIVLFIVVMNFFNPDAFIARQNIQRFKSTGKLDILYLSHLSDDAIPVIIEALNILDIDLRKALSGDLYRRAKNVDSSYFSQWQSLNIAHMRANKILDSKIIELELYKDYQQ